MNPLFSSPQCFKLCSIHYNDKSTPGCIPISQIGWQLIRRKPFIQIILPAKDLRIQEKCTLGHVTLHLKLKCFKMFKVKLMLQLNRLLFLKSHHLNALSLRELTERGISSQIMIASTPEEFNKLVCLSFFGTFIASISRKGNNIVKKFFKCSFFIWSR